MNKFSCEPAKYTWFRPIYTDSLFEYLKTLVNDDSSVLDCGSGSGQGIQGLSHHFKNVIATDLSLELLTQGPSYPNVFYVQSPAEILPIRSNSIDLVCIAQAIHWFSHDDFYIEVKRILKPNGVIAAWGYNQAMIEANVDRIIDKVYKKISSSQNPSRERQYLYEHYQTLPFPFKRISTPDFAIKSNWNLTQWLGYMSTWPGLLEYKKRFDVDLVSEIEDELVLIWGDPSREKLIIWPICLLVGVSNNK